MRETEITVQILGDVESAKRQIESAGLDKMSEFTMTDHYYSKLTKEQIKKLQYEEIIRNSFLLRSFSEEGRPPRILYKNKVLDEQGNVVAEDKVVSIVDDEKNAQRVFDMAGIPCWCEMVQEMTLYKNDKMKFVVQEIDGLGAFIEYEEDDSMTGLDEMEKINLMLSNLKNLGISFGDDFSCKKVYMKLMQEEEIFNM